MRFTEAEIRNMQNYLTICDFQEKYGHSGQEAIEQLVKLFELFKIEGRGYAYAENQAAFFGEAFSTAWDYHVRNIADVEYFFSAVLYIVDKEEWRKLREARLLHNLSELYRSLGLETAIKEESFVMRDVSGSVMYVEDSNRIYEVIYKIWYSLKYIDVPYSVNPELEKVRSFTPVYTTLMGYLMNVYADMMLRHYDVISTAIKKIELEDMVDLNAYCKKITEHWTVPYVNVSWKKKTQEGTYYAEESIRTNVLVDTMNLPEEEQFVKLVGTAGVGKTTALRYLQYRKCTEYLESDKKENVYVPVYIVLSEFEKYAEEANESGESILKRMIKKELCGNDNAIINIEELLKSGKIRLYLDGYNEIPEKGNLRAKFVSVVSNMCGDVEYEKLYWIIADRRDTTQPPYWINKGVCFELVPLSDTQIYNYFEVKLQGQEEHLSRIKSALPKPGDASTDALSWLYGDWAIPHVLEQVIELTKILIEKNLADSYPSRNKFEAFYIRKILEREAMQKSLYIKGLFLWLKALASQASMDPKKEVTCKDADGFQLPSDIQLTASDIRIWALQIPIIKYVEESGTDRITFVYDTYRIFCRKELTTEGTMR